MARKIPLEIDQFYHIYNRGVDKRVVFEHESDHRRFALLLYLCNSKTPVRFDHLPNWKGETLPELIEAVFNSRIDKHIVAIGAYCLMPNHFHLLVREMTEGGISLFMQKLSTAYTMYFNASRKRTGALFQGVFKATHAHSDEYLKYLFSYLHLNPVKLIDKDWKENGIKNIPKTKQFLLSYPYSSYLDYAGMKREFAKILDQRHFPNYFQSKKDIEEHISDWLKYRE